MGGTPLGHLKLLPLENFQVKHGNCHQPENISSNSKLEFVGGRGLKLLPLENFQVKNMETATNQKIYHQTPSWSLWVGGV